MDWPDYLAEARAELSQVLPDLERSSLQSLLKRADDLRRQGHGSVVSFSPKVFIPLTRLCRDVCSYCTFAHSPRDGQPSYLSSNEVLHLANAGAQNGCLEALFTLGEFPEQRYAAARRELRALEHDSTIDYVAEMAELVHRKTGLLVHVNAGVMASDQLSRLRKSSVSQGLMLESSSERLCQKGGPHYGSPGKHPSVRIDTIAAAGRLRIPFTTGILIGIGETRAERIASLLVIKSLHAHHGHIQEVIIQNFRAKAGTRMATEPEPDFKELLWSAASARIVFGPSMNIQVPPNLSNENYPKLLQAGINDWGGVSPITPDHVNPEAPWPEIDRLRAATVAAGRTLVPRLTVYPSFVRDVSVWIDASKVSDVIRASDSEGFARSDSWSPGSTQHLPKLTAAGEAARGDLDGILSRATRGQVLDQPDIVRLFQARGADVQNIIAVANGLRETVSGKTVRYVVNRNVNYTNVCEYRCSFCAFSKGKTSENLRGKPYNVSLEEVARRAVEAWDRGATEVCMQGGIHPNFTGQTYLDLLKCVKASVPSMHVHAFSPLEVTHGAQSLGIPIRRFLEMLRDAGLGSLPGTAAEILDDEVRLTLCPDKLSTSQWLQVMETAHGVGLRTTSTIMFGHMEHPISWARHLLLIRNLQEKTGGFTEFVPLPFVHMEAPLFFRGHARKGPTFRETILMHAIARLALHPVIPNIQVSWVKMGVEGAAACLASGANDMGGTLMNESISRAAGAEFGQELPPQQLDAFIRSIGRNPQQRTTLYALAPCERHIASYDAQPLAPLVAGYLGRPPAAEFTPQ